jgi:hypothetical protein
MSGKPLWSSSKAPNRKVETEASFSLGLCGRCNKSTAHALVGNRELIWMYINVLFFQSTSSTMKHNGDDTLGESVGRQIWPIPCTRGDVLRSVDIEMR